MLELISQISAFLPAYLASPTMYAGMLLVLASGHNRERAFAAWIGSIIAASVVVTIAFSGASAAGGQREPGTASGVIDVLLGLFIIAMAVRRVLRKSKEKNGEPGAESASKHKKRFNFSSPEPQPVKFAILGVLLTLTNPTSMGSLLAAAKLTADSGLATTKQVISMAVAVFYVAVPILIPLILVIVAPASSQKVLSSFNRGLQKYGQYIIVVILLLLGLYLIQKGVGVLK